MLANQFRGWDSDASRAQLAETNFNNLPCRRCSTRNAVSLRFTKFLEALPRRSFSATLPSLSWIVIEIENRLPFSVLCDECQRSACVPELTIFEGLHKWTREACHGRSLHDPQWNEATGNGGGKEITISLRYTYARRAQTAINKIIICATKHLRRFESSFEQPSPIYLLVRSSISIFHRASQTKS